MTLFFARPSPMIYSRNFIFAICHILFNNPFIRNYLQGLYFRVSMLLGKIKSSRTNIVAAFQEMHLSPAKHSYAWLPRKCDYRTNRNTHRQTPGQSDPYVPLRFEATQKSSRINIVAAFQGMHVSPAKQLCVTTKKVWLPDRQTHTQTPDKVISMCRYASRRHKKCCTVQQRTTFYHSPFQKTSLLRL